jgi:predicted O-methyltransferase YrrM
MGNKWYHPSEPGEIKDVPWLHPAVTAYLETLLTKDMEVLEHGCGGSTIWMAERVKFVRCAEHNNEYAKAVNLLAPSNVMIKYGGKIGDFGKNFDLIFIDGITSERTAWMFEAPKLINPGGIIVVDNFNRPEYTKAVEYLRRACDYYVTFMTNSPGVKHTVTEFYFMAGERNG